MKHQQCCLWGRPLGPTLEGETGNPFYWGRRASTGKAKARHPGAPLSWQAKCHSVSQPLGPAGYLQGPCELGGPQGGHLASPGNQCPVPSFPAQHPGCRRAGDFLGLSPWSVVACLRWAALTAGFSTSLAEASLGLASSCLTFLWPITRDPTGCLGTAEINSHGLEARSPKSTCRLEVLPAEAWGEREMGILLAPGGLQAFLGWWSRHPKPGLSWNSPL